MLIKVISHLQQEVQKLEEVRDELDKIKLGEEHEIKLAEEAEQEIMHLLSQDMNVDSDDQD